MLGGLGRIPRAAFDARASSLRQRAFALAAAEAVPELPYSFHCTQYYVLSVMLSERVHRDIRQPGSVLFLRISIPRRSSPMPFPCIAGFLSLPTHIM